MFHNPFFANNDILFFNENFNKVSIFATHLPVDLIKIILGEDNHFNEHDPDTIIHVKTLAWCNKFEKGKALKKR